MVDDLGWQDTSVPFWNQPTTFNQQYHTPNMERMAKGGTIFTSAYATPVCSPSRVSLMTGMNAARHRVTNWTLYPDVKKPMEDKHQELEFPMWNVNGISSDQNTPHAVHVTTLAQQLQNADYHTIHVGKAHFGAKDTPGADPINLGFDVNIAGHAAGAPGSYLGLENFGNLPDRKSSPWPVPGLEAYHNSDIFLTEALTKEAIKTLNSRNKDQAFFLYMAYYGVHTPIMSNKDFFQKYIDQGLDTIEAKYASMIESVDHSIGTILAYLDEEGIQDETAILFMSDNGGLSAHARGGEKHTHNWPLQSGKGSVYEGGIRVPMMAYWPGTFGKERRIDEPIIIEDFYPTILDIAQISKDNITHTIDGQSFYNTLKHDSDTKSDRLLVWHYPNKWGGNGPGIGTYSACRAGDYKFIYNHLTQDVELYNLKDDISESKNLYPDELELTKEIAEELSNYLEEVEAQMPKFKWKKLPVRLPDETVETITNHSSKLNIPYVHKADINIDGTLEEQWNEANVLDHLIAPWNKGVIDETIFKAFHTDSHFYFSFNVKDNDIILEQSFEDEEDNAVRSDRVELFFRKPHQLSPYYSFEMDAAGRVFDSKGVFYRSIEQQWNIDPRALTIKTSRTNQGYILEGSLNKGTLKDLGLISDDGILRTGIYRGNYKLDTEKVEWITWVTPDSAYPDFHIPSSFGTLQLLSSE